MRLLNIIIFLICFLLYLINEVMLKKIRNIFFTGYYNDMLAPILLLSYSNFLLYRHKQLLLGTKSFAFILICSFVWEFLAPLIKENSVVDAFDFIAYIVGCGIYNIILIIYIKRIKKK